MKVYKIKLIKDDKPYFVNSQQKQLIDEAIAKKMTGLFAIGNNQVRINMIESIREVSMDEKDLPDYFNMGTTENNEGNRSITNLPSETILVDENGNIITGATRNQIEKTGKNYMIATAHYVVKDGTKQYYLASKDIKNLTLMVPQSDGYPYSVKQIWHYGQKQL